MNKNVWIMSLLLIFGMHVYQPVVGQYSWRSVNLQGMGYVTGLVVHPNTQEAPNLIYARTDVGGAYRFDGTKNAWIPLMDQFGILDQGKSQVESIAIDPSNPNVVYVVVIKGDTYAPMVVGDILKSIDKGQTWESTGFYKSGQGSFGNGLFRGSSGEKLRVDPNNSSIIYFGSSKSGLWRKVGNEDWAKVTNNLPVSYHYPGFTFVIFDKNSGTVDGKTKNIYAGIYGSGVWRTLDAGDSWEKIGTDTIPLRADVSTNGTLFVTFGGNEYSYNGPGLVMKYANNSWVDITPSSIGKARSYSGISVDANNPNRLVVTTNSAEMALSENGGSSWTKKPVTFTAKPGYYWSSAWYAWGTAALLIDPNDISGKRVWMTNGFAVCKTENINAVSPQWGTAMKNFEEYCATCLKTPPMKGGAQVFTTQLDGIGNRVADKNLVPETRFNMVNKNVAAATGIDYCITRPEYVTYVGFDETNYTPLTGFSSDNGITWTPFKSTSPGFGGVIAMSATDPKNMVWFPKNSSGKGLSYTKDNGNTWSVCFGAPTTTWFRSHEYWAGQTLIADRINGSKFYLLHQNDNGAIEFYVSKNGGADWTKTPATFPGFQSHSVSACVKANPYVEGDILVTSVPNTGASPSNLTKYKLYRSTNSGTSFEVVKSVVSAYASTFAKGDTPGTPYIYIYGRVGVATRDGIYKSTDNGNSWTLINDPQQRQFFGISYMEGDLMNKGLVYFIPGACRGFMYLQDTTELSTGLNYDIKKKPNPRLISNIFPNPAKNEIAITSEHSLVNVNFSISDFKGRMLPVSETFRSGNQIMLSVANLPAGVYIITGRSNEICETKRLIIE